MRGLTPLIRRLPTVQALREAVVHPARGALLAHSRLRAPG